MRRRSAKRRGAAAPLPLTGTVRGDQAPTPQFALLPVLLWLSYFDCVSCEDCAYAPVAASESATRRIRTAFFILHAPYKAAAHAASELDERAAVNSEYFCAWQP